MQIGLSLCLFGYGLLLWWLRWRRDDDVEEWLMVVGRWGGCIVETNFTCGMHTHTHLTGKTHCLLGQYNTIHTKRLFLKKLIPKCDIWEMKQLPCNYMVMRRIVYDKGLLKRESFFFRLVVCVHKNRFFFFDVMGERRLLSKDNIPIMTWKRVK